MHKEAEIRGKIRIQANISYTIYYAKSWKRASGAFYLMSSLGSNFVDPMLTRRTHLLSLETSTPSFYFIIHRHIEHLSIGLPFSLQKSILEFWFKSVNANWNQSANHFYRTQVYLGSDLWVRVSLTNTPFAILAIIAILANLRFINTGASQSYGG